jgi:hypothetical protein
MPDRHSWLISFHIVLLEYKYLFSLQAIRVSPVIMVVSVVARRHLQHTFSPNKEYVYPGLSITNNYYLMPWTNFDK